LDDPLLRFTTVFDAEYASATEQYKIDTNLGLQWMTSLHFIYISNGLNERPKVTDQ